MRTILEKLLELAVYQIEGSGGGGSEAGGGGGSDASPSSPASSSVGADDLADGGFGGLDEVEMDEGGQGDTDPNLAAQRMQQQQPTARREQQASPQQRREAAPRTGEHDRQRPPSIQDIRAGIQQSSEQIVRHLAGTAFRLSDADIQALETDAVAAIPQLLARTAVHAATASLGQIESLVPRLVAEALSAHDTGRAAESQFYAAWPQLSQEKHGAVVMQMAEALRASNPSMPRAQMIKLVGQAVAAHFGLPANMRQGAPPSNGARPQGRGFVPARPGTRMPTAPVGQDWGGMGMDHEEG